MASNREPVKVTPPSSDEDDDGSSSEYESDSQSPPLKAPAKPQSESGSETESESDSDSPANPAVSEARIAPDSTTATQSFAAKRHAEDAEAAAAKVFKRSKETVEAEASEKKNSDEAEPSEKKSTTQFQRFWSEEDEIVILQGMLEYTSRMKVDHVADLSAFRTFIKEKLHFDFSRVQLKDKIWRLKKKYENNKGKAKEGEEMRFLKSHDQDIYELSKLVWGNGKEAALAIAAPPPKNGKDEKNVLKNGKDEKGKQVVAGVSVVGGNAEQRMLMAGKALEGTEEWEKLKQVEMEIYLNMLGMNISRTKLVLEHMRSQRGGRGN